MSERAGRLENRRIALGITGSIAGNVTDNGALAFDRSDIATFAGAITGTGSVSQIGSGTTILTANNTYGGGTTISSGVLEFATTAAMPPNRASRLAT